MAAPKKDPNKVKDTMISVRMRSKDLKVLTDACDKDFIRTSDFAHKAIMDAVGKLIQRQKQRGYQCMVDL